MKKVIILIFLACIAGCDLVDIKLDITPPSAPENLQAVGSANIVTISWAEPSEDVDFTRVIYTNYSQKLSIEVPYETCTRNIQGLTNGKTYAFDVQHVDAWGNESEIKSIAGTPTLGSSDPEAPITTHYILTEKNAYTNLYDRDVVIRLSSFDSEPGVALIV